MAPQTCKASPRPQCWNLSAVAAFIWECGGLPPLFRHARFSELAQGSVYRSRRSHEKPEQAPALQEWTLRFPALGYAKLLNARSVPNQCFAPGSPQPSHLSSPYHYKTRGSCILPAASSPQASSACTRTTRASPGPGPRSPWRNGAFGMPTSVGQTSSHKRANGSSTRWTAM
jgi:hypothetical protein